MTFVILAVLSLIIALVSLVFGGRLFSPKINEAKTMRHRLLSRTTVGGTFLLLAILFSAMTSFVSIGKDEVGLKNKKIASVALPAGRIIATDGERGPQADILGPGWNFSPFINVLFDIERVAVTIIDENQVGYLVAKDGVPFKEGQFLAQPWSDEENMLNASYFLNEGGGQKGPQLTVLKPGKYRINTYLFEVRTGDNFTDAVSVPAGSVGVIKSNVQTDGIEECEIVKDERSTKLSVSIVKVGCRGIWEKAYGPGTYYLNPRAYEVTIVDTRTHAFEYKGGFTRRWINVKLNQDGGTEQESGEERVEVPQGAADRAITLRIEGWEVPQELRILAHVTPEDAPFLVASVGNITDAENKIITPAVRSITRNVTGANSGQNGEQSDLTALESARKVLDLQDKRSSLEADVLSALKPEVMQNGITIDEVRFGDPVIPPELLLARKREQLAEQMEGTYRKEEQAQLKRIATEKARATAEEQPRLVKAEIAVQEAEQYKLAEQLKGEGQKLRLMEEAEGQRAQTEVLGPELTYQLQLADRAFDFIGDHPEAVKVPNVLVQSEGSSLEGAAGILGFLGQGSSLTNGLLPVPKADSTLVK